MNHAENMSHAIAMARHNPQYPFGAVIVDRNTGAILASGRNTTQINPVMHAEVDAICNLSQSRPGRDWGEAVLYTTAEPCPMCLSAIAWARIPMVYYGTSIAWLQANGWEQIDITAAEVARRTPFHCVTVEGGVSEADCNALFEEAQARYAHTAPAP
jgi:tRNA(Arg) A34 adenosine deaminase TadA